MSELAEDYREAGFGARPGPGAGFTHVAYAPGGADGGLLCREVPALRLFEDDAVADRDPRPHEAALLDLGAKYADVHGTAEILDRWEA